MGMIPYDVRSTVSRYSSCSEHSTTIHAFRSATNEGVSSRPMNDIRVLYLKQEGLGAFRFFFKHDKRRMRPQEECFVRSVVLDAHDLG